MAWLLVNLTLKNNTWFASYFQLLHSKGVALYLPSSR